MKRKFENVILTDFNKKGFKNLDLSNVDSILDGLQENINNHSLLGELGVPYDYEISSHNVSFVIERLEYKDNIIYGDVYFLDNEKGDWALNFYTNYLNKNEFKMRSFISDNQIVSIITWDLDFKNNEHPEYQKIKVYGDQKTMGIYEFIDYLETKDFGLFDKNAPYNVKSFKDMFFKMINVNEDELKNELDFDINYDDDFKEVDSKIKQLIYKNKFNTL